MGIIRRFLAENKPSDMSNPEEIRKHILHCRIVPLHCDGFLVYWCVRGIGFGEYTVWRTRDGKWIEDTEDMNDVFVDTIFRAAVEKWKNRKKKNNRWCKRRERYQFEKWYSELRGVEDNA